MSGEKVVFITQARMGSTRLPGKVMNPVLGKPVLFWFLKRALTISDCDCVCVATTTSVADDVIADFVRDEFPGIHVTRGSENDVLARYFQAAQETGADIIIRVTSDDPFFDPLLVARCVAVLKDKNADAVRTKKDAFPIGLDVEVYTRKTLQNAHEKASDSFEREHVGPFIFQTHSSEFVIEWVDNSNEPWPQCRLTLDYPEDFVFLRRLYDEVGPLSSTEDYRKFLEKNPEVADINRNSKRRVVCSETNLD